VIDGGPMMGKILADLEGPITKTTKGLIVLNEDHPLIIRKMIKLDTARRISKTACEQCRMCTDLCPRYLIGHNMQPHKMMRKVNYQYEDLENADIALLCCECNVCELYACPVNLPPRTINTLYKAKLAEKGIKYVPQKTEFYPREIRDYRKVPVKRLILKLGLQAYDKEAPFEEITFNPTTIMIPLKQHTGAPAIPVVSIGQMVKKGDLVGEISDNALGARVHASISGRVTGIDKNIMIESI
jgi:Na+-translocating ferredoxin:NAD+ oxidoreductase RnfC subunit